MADLSKKYRLKAFSCEKLSREAPDSALRVAWAEIAIEWHALANRTAEGSNRNDSQFEIE